MIESSTMRKFFEKFEIRKQKPVRKKFDRHIAKTIAHHTINQELVEFRSKYQPEYYKEVIQNCSVYGINTTLALDNAGQEWCRVMGGQEAISAEEIANDPTKDIQIRSANQRLFMAFASTDEEAIRKARMNIQQVIKHWKLYHRGWF